MHALSLCCYIYCFHIDLIVAVWICSCTYCLSEVILKFVGIDDVGIRSVNNDFDYRTSIQFVDLY